jgi:hypothetical protein
LAVGKTPLIRRSLHLAIVRSRPDAERIVERFNQQLRNLVVDGSYHRALAVGWIQTDVDGDGVEELVASGKQAGKAAPSQGYAVPFLKTGTARAATERPPYERFYIDGVTYQGWEEVPEAYKIDPDGRERPPRGFQIRVFEF